MSIYGELASVAYWSDPVVRSDRLAVRMTGVPDELEAQLRHLWIVAQSGAHVQNLEPGQPLADAAESVPAHLYGKPWMLGVVMDTRRRGKVQHPAGLLMGRDAFLDEAAFDAQAQKLVDKSLRTLDPAVVLATGEDGKPRTLKRELLFFLGRTVPGEVVDCTANGEPSLIGLPAKRLPLRDSVWRDMTAHLPASTEVGTVYTNKSGTKQRVVSAASLIIPYQQPPFRGGRRKITIALPAKKWATAPSPVTI